MRRTFFCAVGRNAIASLVILFAGTAPAIAQKTYSIAQVIFGNGYTADGFIVTDGSIGNLAASNIINYEVRVNGPTPFVFTPSNPSGRVTIGFLGGALAATASSLTLPLDIDPGNPYQELNFETIDNATGCFRQIRWTNNAFPGTPAGISAVEYTNSCGTGGFVNMTLPSLPQRAQTIAVANSFAFAGLLEPYGSPEQKQFRSGRTIPLKWQIANEGQPMDSAAYPASVAVFGPNPCGQAGGNLITVETSGDGGYNYEIASKTWNFNWNTSPSMVGCFNIVLEQPQLGLIKSFPIKLAR